MTTWPSTRSTVFTTGDMVCSNSPLAASAGLEVMAHGGNAFDAIIAASAVEAVTLPGRCSLGGEAFGIMYQAGTGRCLGLTSSGPAPMSATPAFYRSKGYTAIPVRGPLAVSPPGEVAAYQIIADTLGSKPLAQLLEPAIGYAEEGFPIPRSIHRSIVGGQETLRQFPEAAAIYLKDGEPYREGDVLVQRDLAGTLRRVARGGVEEFYRGDLAREIVKGFEEAGGIITLDDLGAVEAELYEPLSTTYRGYTVLETRPPSQGMLLLEMLNIIEGFDIGALGFLSPQCIHVMVEAKKLAFADRNEFLADPRMEQTPLEELLTKEHAERRRALIDLDRASVRTESAALASVGGDTSFLCAADRAGNTVSFIHSVYANFGSAFVAPGTGIVFNNRQRGFRLEEGHPNTMAPRKRPMHTLNAYSVLKDGAPVLVGGTPGADTQVQANMQMITEFLDFGMGLQEAVDAPRWVSTPGSDPDSMSNPPRLHLEGAVPQAVADGLAGMGHDVTRDLAGINIGIVQLIAIDPATGVKAGASDPRGDGHAAAQ
jgi:gamma-glutamyltranspeptidase/glutathione hydrolase